MALYPAFTYYEYELLLPIIQLGILDIQKVVLIPTYMTTKIILMCGYFKTDKISRN